MRKAWYCNSNVSPCSRPELVNPNREPNFTWWNSSPHNIISRVAAILRITQYLSHTYIVLLFNSNLQPILTMTQIDSLLNLAWEHVQGICMNKDALPCLPDHIIIQFPQELCLRAIHDLFDLHQDKLSISVSESLCPRHGR